MKGFSHEWGDQDVIKLFHEAVNIEDVRIVKDKNHKSKGFGYVEFKSQEAAREGTTDLIQPASDTKQIQFQT